MTSTLEPGQEIERCRLFQVPPEGLHVQGDEVRFTQGSHHIVLYKTSYTELPTENLQGEPIDPTQVHDCNNGAAADWEVSGIVAGSQSFEGDSMLGRLPPGVAIPLDPGTVLVMNTHYLNASPDPIEVEARINLYTIPAEEVQVEASMLFHYNPFIRVPANGAASARMRCTIPQDISIVRLQSHMHRRGVGYEAFLTDGAGEPVEQIYTTTRWEQVPARDFDPPLEVKAGQALDFRCDYMNPEGRDVAQGLTTRDEMCMLLGPYFPKDPRIDACVDADGWPAETWIGSGSATCAETLGCMSQAMDASDFFGCVVDSCPGAAKEVSEVVRCNGTDAYGTCGEACATDAGACTSCMETACATAINACLPATCS
jgi:hypothetical protein